MRLLTLVLLCFASVAHAETYQLFGGSDPSALENADPAMRRLALSAVLCNAQAATRVRERSESLRRHAAVGMGAMRGRFEAAAAHERLKRFHLSPLGCGGKVAALLKCTEGDGDCGQEGEVYTSAAAEVSREADEKVEAATRD